MFSQKRSRDEFDEPDSQVEHERKKPRPLPFRTSPTSKHTTLFSQHHEFLPRSDHTLTPNESSDDEDDNDKQQRPKQGFRPPIQLPFLQQPAELQAGSTDGDMEMVDSEPPPPETLSPWSAGITNGGTLMPSPIPGNLINQSLSISGGRTATPIYGHFTRNMDLNAMAQTGTTGLAPPGGPVSSPFPSAAESDWWRRRRLPSPISEGEDSLASPADCMTERLQARYGEILQSKPDEDLPNASFMGQNQMTNAQRPGPPPQIITSNADESGVSRGHLGSYVELSAPPSRRFPAIDTSSSNVPPENAAPVPSRSRSNAFGSSSGGKVGFSMGYRSDCDKCLRKVPGHYSHIIRS